MAQGDLLYLGKDEQGQPVSVPVNDLLQSQLVVGQSGTGKSTFLKVLLQQLMALGYGVLLLEPHGDLTAELLALVPKDRRDDVIVLDPADEKHPFSLNLCEVRNPYDEKEITRTAEWLVASFKKLWSDSWGARLENLLRMLGYLLCSNQGSTLVDIPRVLEDEIFRRELIAGMSIKNQVVAQFFEDDFGEWTKRLVEERTESTMTRIRAILAAPQMRRILGQPKGSVDTRAAIDNRKLVFVPLRTGSTTDHNAGLLGGLVVGNFVNAAFTRDDISEESRVPFFVFVDECHKIPTPDVGTFIWELRKFKLGSLWATQDLSKVDSPSRHALMGAKTTVVFRVGLEDAYDLAGMFTTDPHPNPPTLELFTLPEYESVTKVTWQPKEAKEVWESLQQQIKTLKKLQNVSPQHKQKLERLTRQAKYLYDKCRIEKQEIEFMESREVVQKIIDYTIRGEPVRTNKYRYGKVKPRSPGEIRGDIAGMLSHQHDREAYVRYPQGEKLVEGRLFPPPPPKPILTPAHVEALLTQSREQYTTWWEDVDRYQEARRKRSVRGAVAQPSEPPDDTPVKRSSKR